MSEPKHSNVLLGKSIREIRLRRGLTQREVSEAIGGISESASSTMTNSCTHFSFQRKRSASSHARMEASGLPTKQSSRAFAHGGLGRSF